MGINEIFDFGIDFSKMKKAEVIRDIFIFFIIYCIVGWIYEGIVFVVEEHQLLNRGFLFGPWLPIYGVGGLLITIIFYRTKNKPIKIGKVNIRPLIIYLESCILATAVELATTYIIDYNGGNFKTLWDYSENFMNFQGRIALIPDAKFGIIALISIYWMQPMLNRFVLNNKKVVNTLAISTLTLFSIDLISRIWLGSNFVG